LKPVSLKYSFNNLKKIYPYWKHVQHDANPGKEAAT